MPTSTITFVKDMQFVAETGSGHAIVLDGPEDFGGHDTGVRPMELLLAGLGGCTGMDVVSILRKKRQRFTGVSVHVRGEKAENHPMRFTKIHVEYEVRGYGLSEQAVKRSIELSMNKYCSVSATLGGTAEIEHSFRIVEEEHEKAGG